MIRNGKAAGWLNLSSSAFQAWSVVNEVDFRCSIPGSIEGRGGALLAKQALNANSDDSQILLAVPHDLILSQERVELHAKADQDFRQVLESIGDLGRTARGAILSFLLVQASISCPILSSRVSIHGPFVDYVKSLPLEDLPTFWSPEELQLLVGTTLAPALASKLRNLRREYDELCSSAADTRWLEMVEEILEFDDWCQVDAMYRSRALDFPNIGHCMVPCVDLANHAGGDSTIAIYEKDQEGNAFLLLRDGKRLEEGEEITITYGDEKGACEMLFSYGFLPQEMKSAETLFLSLALPDDDKFRIAKMEVADTAPGFKLIDTNEGKIDWNGDFIWMMCVSEEDGLHFELARTLDGDEEVLAFLGNAELTGGAAQLRTLLAESDLWDVYRLRAVTILQLRIFDQLQVLYTTQEQIEDTAHGTDTSIDSARFQTIMQLRRLEFDLMERAYEWFESEKNELADSEVVRRFLAEVNNDEPLTTSDIDTPNDVEEDSDELS